MIDQNKLAEMIFNKTDVFYTDPVNFQPVAGVITTTRTVSGVLHADLMTKHRGHVTIPVSDLYTEADAAEAAAVRPEAQLKEKYLSEIGSSTASLVRFLYRNLEKACGTNEMLLEAVREKAEAVCGIML